MQRDQYTFSAISCSVLAAKVLQVHLEVCACMQGLCCVLQFQQPMAEASFGQPRLIHLTANWVTHPVVPYARPLNSNPVVTHTSIAKLVYAATGKHNLLAPFLHVLHATWQHP